MTAISFDDDAYWDGQHLIFWASRGNDRTRCRMGRSSINGLPGFTNASSQEIDMRKSELAELLKPFASRKISAGEYIPDLRIRTVEVIGKKRYRNKRWYPVSGVPFPSQPVRSRPGHELSSPRMRAATHEALGLRRRKT